MSDDAQPDEIEQQFEDEVEGSVAPEGEETVSETTDVDEGGGNSRQPRELDTLYATNRRLQQQLEEQSAMVRQLMERLTPDEPEPPAQKPAMEDFDSEEAYFDALSDWKLERYKAEQEEARQREAAERQHTEQRTSIEQAYARMQESGRKKYADYDPVVSSAPLHNPVIGVAVARSEMADEVSYYLGNHHDVAARLDQMDPIDAAREIGRIESQLQAKARKRRVSGAPASPSREGGASAPETVMGGYNPALSVEENARERLKQRARG